MDPFNPSCVTIRAKTLPIGRAADRIRPAVDAARHVPATRATPENGASMRARPDLGSRRSHSGVSQFKYLPQVDKYLPSK